jgi:hypothetical protein
MTSISENLFLNQEVNSSIKSFFKEFGVGMALRQANAYKSKGFHPVSLMQYLVQLVYMGKSMYRDYRSGGASVINTSTDAIYRFLRNASINWSTFLLVIGAKVANWVNMLTKEERLNALILDDTLCERKHSKKTELVSRVFDHTDRKYKRGYRTLFLGWTDWATFVPVMFRHMASAKPKNVYCAAKANTDKRTCGARAKKEATMKATDVSLKMLKLAKKYALPAKHVLFDSWFTNPTFVIDILEIGYHAVGRLKKGNTQYGFEGKGLTLTKIYNSCKKRRGRSRYLLCVDVVMESRDKKAKMKEAPARIVYVRNAKKRKDWIAFLCTDMTLTEDQIVELYGKRWSIEVFFKTCKSFLKFTGEFHQTSYEAITAHTAVVALRYMILALEQRKNTDSRRTPGDIFFLFTDEAKDIELQEVLEILLDELATMAIDDLGLDEESVMALLDSFMNALPRHLQSLREQKKAS